jgi:ATP-dependent helicase/nuclease subunit A
VPSFAQLLHGVCETCQGLHHRPEAAQLALDVAQPAPGEPVEAPGTAEQWRAARDALLERVRVAGVASPSRLGHEAPSGAEEDQRVPGRGEGGTARGRAVHAVLQAVSLPDATDLDDLARVEAANEGLAGRAGEVAEVARAALAAPVVQRALAARRSWRELAVVASVDGHLVEGFIDLAFESDDGGLVVVDYKTDALGAGEHEDAVARYRLQIGAYAAALAAATGREVSEGWLVFAGREGAVERSIDLASVAPEVEAALRA